MRAPGDPVRVVAALIPDPKGDRFLIQQRLPGARRGLLWEFPGGKVESGESDAQALVRECREELGIELSVGKCRWIGRHRYPDIEVELLLYEAEILRGTPVLRGAHALRFASIEEMSGLPFCDADLPLLAALGSG